MSAALQLVLVAVAVMALLAIVYGVIAWLNRHNPTF